MTFNDIIPAKASLIITHSVITLFRVLQTVIGSFFRLFFVLSFKHETNESIQIQFVHSDWTPIRRFACLIV